MRVGIVCKNETEVGLDPDLGPVFYKTSTRKPTTRGAQCQLMMNPLDALVRLAVAAGHDVSAERLVSDSLPNNGIAPQRLG